MVYLVQGDEYENDERVYGLHVEVSKRIHAEKSVIAYRELCHSCIKMASRGDRGKRIGRAGTIDVVGCYW